MWEWVKKWWKWLLAGLLTCGIGFFVWKRPARGGYVPLGTQGDLLGRAASRADRARTARETAAARKAAREKNDEDAITGAGPDGIAALADGIVSRQRGK